MNHALIGALARELAPRLEGLRLEAVRETSGGALWLVFGHPLVHILLDAGGGPGGSSTRSGTAGGSPAPEALFEAKGDVALLRSGESAFTLAAASKLQGLPLTRLHQEAGERIVEFCFEGGARLIAELFGARATLVLVGVDGTVQAASRSVPSGRRLGKGTTWSPPVRHEAPPDGAANRIAAATAPPAVVRPEGAPRLSSSGRSRGAVLLSDRPLDAFGLERIPPESELGVLLADDPAAADPGVLTAFDSVSAAVEAAWQIRSRAASFVARRDGLAAILAAERKRLGKLLPHLEGDLAKIPAPGAHRREAEALLAGLSVARKSGEWVEVPDPYGGEALRVKIDPARSLQENAEILFDRERKMERGRETVRERIAEARVRSGALAEAEGKLAEAAAPEQLSAVEAAMRALGLLLSTGSRKLDTRSKRGRSAAAEATNIGGASAGSSPQLAGIRRYESSDGLEILVGKTGRENDRLTFRVAGPEDFWFHAADAAGAHVVVRNPDRLEHLPAATLREAAGLAALFSKSANEGKAEVHMTRRKNVKKPRGAPAGQVLLKKFTSIRVAPGLPENSLLSLISGKLTGWRAAGYPAPRRSPMKILKIAVGTAFGLGLLYLSLKDVNLGEVAAGMRQASWPLIGASLFVGILIHNLLRAWRWRVLLTPEKPGIGIYNLFSTILIGYAISFALPMRLGEVLRPMLLAEREHIRPTVALTTVALERVMDGLAVLALFGVSLLVWDGRARLGPEGEQIFAGFRLGGMIMLVLAVIVAAGGLVALWTRLSWEPRLEAFAGRTRSKFLAGLSRAIIGFIDGATVLQRPGLLAASAGLSIVIWLVIGVSTWFGLAAAGIRLGFEEVFILLPASVLGIGIPSPGGVGSFEYFVSQTLHHILGQPLDLALAATLILHIVITLVPVILVGMFFLWKDGVSIERMKAALSMAGGKPAARPVTP